MRFLITFVGLLGVTNCLEWNPLQQVQDTPEVAAAKAAHLAVLSKAKEKAREKARYRQDGTWIEGKNSLKESHEEAWKRGWKDVGTWGGAIPDVGSQNDDGSWKGDDSWKNYDDGSWEQDDKTTEKPKLEQTWDGNERWTGPVALPPGYDETGAPLPVEDTPEVAAAKAKHLLLYAKAVSRSQSASPLAPNATPIQQNHQQHKNNAIFTSSVKPKARPPPGRSAPPPNLPAPVWETNGEVQDTPEVAAAKAAHYAAHARRRS